MSANTGIEWTDHTWNPVRGCSRVSEGCRNCYAESVANRFSGKGQPYEGLITKTEKGPTWNGKTLLLADKLDEPIRLIKGRRIFVNSMSDLFHESVPFEFIADVFAVMACTTRHTYQVLTKRPARMLEFFKWLDEDGYGLNSFYWPEKVSPTKVWPKWTSHGGKRAGYDTCGPAWPLENVWLGVSIEDQSTADERIPLLLGAPAAVRWVSAEPLLGPLDLSRFMWPVCGWWQGPCNSYEEAKAAGDVCGLRRQALVSANCRFINWLVAGGESGANARPMHPNWARSLRDQCQAAGVPFFFKQWGEWAPRSRCYHALTNALAAEEVDPGATKWPCIRLTESGGNGRDLSEVDGGDDCYMQKVGKKLSGRYLDFRDWNEFPETTGKGGR